MRFLICDKKGEILRSVTIQQMDHVVQQLGDDGHCIYRVPEKVVHPDGSGKLITPGLIHDGKLKVENLTLIHKAGEAGVQHAGMKLKLHHTRGDT